MIVGVVGGGQLARMMIPAAVELGIDIAVLAETEGAPAALAATRVGDYRDEAVVLAFAETVDVVTFDHEHVPQPILRELVEMDLGTASIDLGRLAKEYKYSDEKDLRAFLDRELADTDERRAVRGALEVEAVAGGAVGLEQLLAVVGRQ